MRTEEPGGIDRLPATEPAGRDRNCAGRLAHFQRLALCRFALAKVAISLKNALSGCAMRLPAARLARASSAEKSRPRRSSQSHVLICTENLARNGANPLDWTTQTINIDLSMSANYADCWA